MGPKERKKEEEHLAEARFNCIHIYCPVSCLKKLSQKRIKNNVNAADNSS